MRIATWNVRTLYRVGAMREMVKEMAKYKIDIYVKYLIIIPKEVDQEDDQETDGGIVYKQTLKSVKLTTGKKGKKTELTGKGPLRRRRSSLECSATEEEEEQQIMYVDIMYVTIQAEYY
jgi:hypothetical protein